MSENGKKPAEKSQILITFRDRKSIEFDIQLVNVAAAQMFLVAQWLDFRAKAFMAAAEAEKQSRLASVEKSKSSILVPGMKVM